MLYVTTRNRRNTYTAHQALTQGRGEDSGLFLPLHFPELSTEEIRKLTAMTFGQRVAQMLNLFFTTNLTGWDIDFCIGRYPVRTEQLVHRIILAETWHNPDRKYQRLENNLKELLCTQVDVPGNWVSIAVRMAILAGILGTRMIQETGSTDIAVVSGDFTTPISLWYLRKMGFPVGNIICCCNENNQFWELFCNGQMHTDCTPVTTIVQEADVTLPVNVERLICDCGNIADAERYMDSCQNRTMYAASDMLLQKLRHGLYVSVVSSSRVETVIPNVYKTHKYVLSPASALAYSGLLDYRTKTGITRTAIVLCDGNPICDAATVAKAMEISEEALKNLI